MSVQIIGSPYSVYANEEVGAIFRFGLSFLAQVVGESPKETSGPASISQDLLVKVIRVSQLFKTLTVEAYDQLTVIHFTFLNEKVLCAV